MSVEFKGQLDEKLYRRVLRYLLRGLTSWAIVMLAAFVWILFTVPAAQLLDVRMLIVLLPIYVLFVPFITARRAMKTSKLIAEPFHGSADETHFVYETQFGRTDVPWEKLYRTRVTRDFILIYPSAQMFFLLTPRFFASGNDWAEFGRLVTANVKQMKKSSPFIKTVMLWLAIIVVVFVVWSFVQR